MKKIIWIAAVGCVVLVVVLVGRQRVQEKVGHASGLSTVEHVSGTKERESKTSVHSVPSSEAGGESSFSDGQAESAAPQELSAPVKALLLQDGKEHNYATLLAEISKLKYELSSADVAALMEMLAWSNDQFPEGMRSIEINAVKNDVLDKLLRQETLPEGIGLQMVAMAQDAEADSVWRDYCVQFMGPFFERKSQVERSKVEGLGAGGVQASATGESDQGVASTQELTAVSEAMFSALDERSDTLAGTALIGLENLSRTYEEFDKELITVKAVEIASDDLASNESRLTALRMASGLATKGTEERKETASVNSVSSSKAGGELNSTVADAARELAQTGETVYMRSAAIVTLGEVGTADDRELIESFALSDNKQIADAAKMALAKMNREWR
jgi:hypothetical protein